MGTLSLPADVVANGRRALDPHRLPDAAPQVMEAIELAYPGIAASNVHVWTLGGKSRERAAGDAVGASGARSGAHLVEDGWPAAATGMRRLHRVRHLRADLPGRPLRRRARASRTCSCATATPPPRRRCRRRASTRSSAPGRSMCAVLVQVRGLLRARAPRHAPRSRGRRLRRPARRASSAHAARRRRRSRSTARDPARGSASADMPLAAADHRRRRLLPREGAGRCWRSRGYMLPRPLHRRARRRAGRPRTSTGASPRRLATRRAFARCRCRCA